MTCYPKKIVVKSRVFGRNRKTLSDDSVTD